MASDWAGVVSAYGIDEFSQQEQDNSGVLRHGSNMAALSVALTAQAIKNPPLLTWRTVCVLGFVGRWIMTNNASKFFLLRILKNLGRAPSFLYKRQIHTVAITFDSSNTESGWVLLEAVMSK